MTIYKGKMSWFGGPHDKGVQPYEGLALYTAHDVKDNPELFLKEQPPHTSGLARRLNPDAYYIAMRWKYKEEHGVDQLRKTQVKVTNPKNGKSVLAWPADWGPNIRTGRIADLSPGILKALDLETNDEVEVDVPDNA